MRTVTVTSTAESPSFPIDAPANSPLSIQADRLWQVVCGDRGHWRAGIFSPVAASLAECPELERHTCPELFILISGSLTLVLLKDGKVEEMPLQPERPVLVTCPHAGYCPNGPHTGRAFVVERDAFSTVYEDLLSEK